MDLLHKYERTRLGDQLPWAEVAGKDLELALKHLAEEKDRAVDRMSQRSIWDVIPGLICGPYLSVRPKDKLYLE